MTSQSEGKLIVIEGGDGSGKGTQSALLQEYFKKQTIPYAYVDFPDYDSLYGKIIARFLRGEFGTLDEVSPYFVGVLFALDRTLQKKMIDQHLAAGKIVLANRYIPSNIAHQASKFDTPEERDAFITWISDLEYGVNGMPEETRVIYLHVPWQQSQQMIQSKQAREYLQGATEDIQEKNTDYRQKTEEMYCYLAEKGENWSTIDCTKNGTILSKDAVHNLIVAELQKHAIV